MKFCVKYYFSMHGSHRGTARSLYWYLNLIYLAHIRCPTLFQGSLDASLSSTVSDTLNVPWIPQ